VHHFREQKRNEKAKWISSATDYQSLFIGELLEKQNIDDLVKEKIMAKINK